MHAINNWQFDSIKILIEAGANINLKDQFGFNAIERAELKGLKSVVNFLKN